MPAPWSKEMTDVLISMYQNHTASEISKHLGVTRNAIEQRAKRVNLYKNKKPWNKSDTNELLLRYPNEKNKEIAKSIGRSVSCILSKAKRMKLKKTKKFNANL